ncbi:MAG: type III pantothenate kinase [Rhodospirillaceae bacterium]|nr:type III pantothenate kinase [Rhodospirillaceae bacterium]
MLLAIDVGNTNIVFAVFDEDGSIHAQWRLATIAEITSDELSDWLDRALGDGNIEKEDITDAIISSVVPNMLAELVSFCKMYISGDPLVVGENGVLLGIEALVDNPSEVGADRLVNAVGAAEKYNVPLIVIDFGTATTFDVVDENGNYAGGVIAPGINLSLDALHSATAKLPKVKVIRPERVVGKATVPAMQSGIYWGYISIIEGIVKRIKDELSLEMSVVATGGLAHLFSEGTDVIKLVDSNLTVNGLFAIWRKNKN